MTREQQIHRLKIKRLDAIIKRKRSSEVSKQLIWKVVRQLRAEMKSECRA